MKSLTLSSPKILGFVSASFLIVSCQFNDGLTKDGSVKTIDKDNPAGETSVKNTEPLKDIKTPPDALPLKKPVQKPKQPVPVKK